MLRLQLRRTGQSSGGTAIIALQADPFIPKLFALRRANIDIIRFEAISIGMFQKPYGLTGKLLL